MKQNETSLQTLKPKEVQTLLAMVTTTSDEEAIRLCPYSKSQYYRLKPTLALYKQEFLARCTKTTTDMLMAASMHAAMELAKELDDKSVHVRNKASNDILDRVIPKGNGVAVQVNNNPSTIRVISYKDYLDDNERKSSIIPGGVTQEREKWL